MHPLPRCGLIFCFQMPYFLHWLFSSTLLTQLKLPEASEQAAKNFEGAAHGARASARAYTPQTLRTQVLKKWPPSQLVFAVRTSPNAHHWNLGNTGHFRNCWVLHQNKIRQHGVARFFFYDNANITKTIKNAHLAKLWFDFPLPNAIFFTLAFQ